MRLALPFMILLGAASASAQQGNPSSAPALPEAPSSTLVAAALPLESPSSSLSSYTLYPAAYEGVQQSESQAAIPPPSQTDKPKPRPLLGSDLDANGKPIPLNRQQPQRILGFMPNFRSVSGGAKPHPPGWGYNFKIATRQAFDYSSFIFLGLTSISAEGLNEHPVLGKGIHGMYEYTWRGLIDKTDGTYIGAWFLPSLLHEDTRYYALGNDHRVVTRALYVISRQGVTRTYGGRQTPNIAGLGGKVLTQIVSREYYPTGATDFAVLAEKFGYAAMRDVIFTSIREFYPDIAAHYIRKHREKMAALQAQQP